MMKPKDKESRAIRREVFYSLARSPATGRQIYDRLTKRKIKTNMAAVFCVISWLSGQDCITVSKADYKRATLAIDRIAKGKPYRPYQPSTYFLTPRGKEVLKGMTDA